MLDDGCWMLDAGCWMRDVGCWVLNLPTPLASESPSPAQGGRSCSHPSLVASAPTESPPTFLPLLGPQHPLGHGLGLTKGSRAWMEQRGCAGGERRGRAWCWGPVPQGTGASQQCCLDQWDWGMVWAAGDLSWSLHSVTHTHHTPGRGQGQCWQCDGYWSNPAALWDLVGQVRAPGVLELQAETRSGAGLGEAALFSWLPLE